MEPQERARWAFRTWTMLQGRLSRSANHGLICGLTSSQVGEGRTTWINLLAEAASLTGFRVLTIATTPPPTDFPSTADNDEENVPQDSPMNPTMDSSMNSTMNPGSALATSVLTSPSQVTEQLTGPNSQPVVHIPLPGWVWNLERRKQWREALSQWRKIDNLVILVELPPASLTEAVLLGCNLPNIVWLADSGVPDAAETRAQLETLRNARCNLVGAVLNRCLGQSIKSRFPRWVECAALYLLFASFSLCAQNTEVAAAAPPPAPAVVPLPAPVEAQPAPSFSIVSPTQRAAWQQRLTLGPGDVLNLGLYGQPELTRTDVAIAPDGMVNYLDATNVLATGLTIDELRAKLDEQLGLYRRAPRTLITPVAFHSKKYYVLGKVMTKGVYTLDRPITVLEAIARAHGLENGLVNRNVIDLADFQRSFLMRGGKRYSLDFEKLFQQGDLSQNIAIEPGDYLYFPGETVHEVYVVGEVRLPGTVTYSPDLTIMAALSARGGYTDRAYKARVLVVRGSLNNPEAIAVDTHAILDGKALNFKLRPKDIIYVNSRPFIRVEELADLAATAFIQSIITEATGVSVVKPIQ
jgi:protein involved in polysaccharide export with SLBB domain